MVLFAPLPARDSLAMSRSKPVCTGIQPGAWGNPLWGDFNNDGLLDLLVPNHELQLSGGPYIYLNNGNGTFTDVISTSGIGKEKFRFLIQIVNFHQGDTGRAILALHDCRVVARRHRRVDRTFARIRRS